MVIIKRDGSKVEFDYKKIENAILKAMKYGSGRVDIDLSLSIAKLIEHDMKKHMKTITIYEVEKMVFDNLCDFNHQDTARAYEGYRAIREFQKKQNTIDNSVMSLIELKNEELKSENSNKNATLLSTQRDYMAGEICKDIYLRKYLPTHLTQAHNEGMIHIHDGDYLFQKLTNCGLVNIKDMLDNGTVINKNMIESPKTFKTACTIMTQIIAQVASFQFGGQSMNIKHLGKYLRRSREKYEKLYSFLKEEERIRVVNTVLQEELKSGVQTIQYQINTFLTTNGQTPFVTLFLEIDEKDEYKDEVAQIIYEIFRQRIIGIKNEAGQDITPTFPKLVYVLDEHNNLDGGKYDWVTKEAIKCNVKRFYPDYISAKKMRENYEGNVFSPMGCVDGEELITYKFKGKLYVESFARMWNNMGKNFHIKEQESKGSFYIDLSNVEIYDSSKNSLVKCNRIIKNKDKGDWNLIKFSNGRSLVATLDHPLPILDKGRIFVKDLHIGDKINIVQSQYVEERNNMDIEKAWLLGFILCDGCYDGHIWSSIALNGEDDIERRYITAFKKVFDREVRVQIRQRGVKGNYKDLITIGSVSEIRKFLENEFGGLQKINRQIPNSIFESNKEARLSFLGGMIDADGYINSTKPKKPIIQVGSTNKELALQTLALIQSLGYPTTLHRNHYNSKDKSKIRYLISFVSDKELIGYISCEKKREKFTNEAEIVFNNIAKVNSIEFLGSLDKFSYDVTTESDKFDVSGISSHNCRSFLSPWKDSEGEYKFEGRFNFGVTSLNLPRVALDSNGDIKEFWKLLDNRLELCYENSIFRYNYLKGTLSDVAPILWQYGGYARLKKGETIDSILSGGFSTVSIGYIGLYEMTKVMIGESHTTEKGQEFALQVMNHIRNKIDKWKKDTGLGFGFYSSPSEALCYRFAKIDKKLHGSIKDITDKNYYTNSYHYDVREEVDAFEKLRFESQFQSIASGGCISYCELPNMKHNLEAIEGLVKYIYKNVQYGEFNIKSDVCHICDYDGEMKINEKFKWECPSCGNADMDKMTVVRRTCGYLGSNYWNEGKTQEIGLRVLHL